MTITAIIAVAIEKQSKNNRKTKEDKGGQRYMLSRGENNMRAKMPSRAAGKAGALSLFALAAGLMLSLYTSCVDLVDLGEESGRVCHWAPLDLELHQFSFDFEGESPDQDGVVLNEPVVEGSSSCEATLSYQEVAVEYLYQDISLLQHNGSQSTDAGGRYASFSSNSLIAFTSDFYLFRNDRLIFPSQFSFHLWIQAEAGVTGAILLFGSSHVIYLSEIEGKLYVAMEGSQDINYKGSQALSSSAWHHLAITRQDDGYNSIYSFYHNGERLETEILPGGQAPRFIRTASSRIAVLSSGLGGGVTGSGLVHKDKIVYSDQALSAAEIRSLFQKSRDQFL